jgi:adenylate cyclase
MLGELNPSGGGDPIPLLQDKLLVGRRSSCDIRLEFPNVSSHHCELELKGGYWHVKDLGSSNGVKVNGERTTTHWLMPGDELQIAKHCYRIEYVVSGNAPPPEDDNPFAVGLMEKAGLETSQRKSRMPEAAGNSKVRSQRRSSSQDDFIMEWLSED